MSTEILLLLRCVFAHSIQDCRKSSIVLIHMEFSTNNDLIFKIKSFNIMPCTIHFPLKTMEPAFCLQPLRLILATMEEPPPELDILYCQETAVECWVLAASPGLCTHGCYGNTSPLVTRKPNTARQLTTPPVGSRRKRVMACVSRRHQRTSNSTVPKSTFNVAVATIPKVHYQTNKFARTSYIRAAPSRRSHPWV